MLRLALSSALLVYVSGMCEMPETAEGGEAFNPLEKYLNKIDECKRLREGEENGGYNVPGLTDEVNACIKETHEKAKCCIMKEMKTMKGDPGKKACFKLHKDSHTELMRLSCKWHQHIKDCMKGEAAAATHEEHTADHDQEIADFDRFANLQHQDCWADVKTRTESCMQRARDSNAKFKICSGFNVEGADEAEQKWYNLVKHTNYMKVKHMMEGQRKWQECLANPPAEEEARYRRARARRHVHNDEEDSEDHDHEDCVTETKNGRRVRRCTPPKETKVEVVDPPKQSDESMFFW